MFRTQVNLQQAELQNILKDYEDLAGSNPMHLRTMIPTEEIWRFFVNGDHQEKGKNIRAYFVGRDIPNCSIKELAEKEASTENCTWESAPFMQLVKKSKWNLTEAECALMTVEDFLCLDQAWMQYENEKNYLLALTHAFQEIFDFDVAADANFVKKLQGIAGGQVGSTNYDNEETVNKPGQFRMTEAAFYNLTPNNGSAEGYLEVLDRNVSCIWFELEVFDSNDNNMQLGVININAQNLQKIKYAINDIDAEKKSRGKTQSYNFPLAEYCESFDKREFIQSIKNNENNLQDLLRMLAASKNNKDLADIIFNLVKNPVFDNYQFSLKSKQMPEDEVQQILEREIAKKFVAYEEAIRQSKNPLEKVYAIVSLAQECDQVHPFIDINGRAFYLLLMNYMLMREGFPPVILNSIVRISARSKEYVVQEVLVGMQNTLQLVKEKKLFNIVTADIIKQLSSRPGLKYYADYFSEVCKIEEIGRANMHNKKNQKNI